MNPLVLKSWSQIKNRYIASVPLYGESSFESDLFYVENALSSYSRTFNDCLALPCFDKGSVLKICELGAFFGVLSYAFNLQGHNVTACDIPSFYDDTPYSALLSSLGLNVSSFNLRTSCYPFSNSVFDLIIACELFEHLNFNPIPVILGLNRVLALGGYVYVSMPNSASVIKRLRFLLTGKHPTFTIDELYSQLDPARNMIVGLHWREYSPSEVKSLFEPLGFELISLRIVSDTGSGSATLLRRLIRRFLYSLPFCGQTQVVVLKKIANISLESLGLSVNNDS